MSVIDTRVNADQVVKHERKLLLLQCLILALIFYLPGVIYAAFATFGSPILD